MKHYRLLRFVRTIYSLLGWLAIIAAVLVVCGFGAIGFLSGQRNVTALVLSMATGVATGIGLFIGGFLALTIASLIDIQLEIHDRLFQLPLPPRAPALPSPVASTPAIPSETVSPLPAVSSETTPPSPPPSEETPTVL